MTDVAQGLKCSWKMEEIKKENYELRVINIVGASE